MDGLKTAEVSKWLQELAECGIDDTDSDKIMEVVEIINKYQD